MKYIRSFLFCSLIFVITGCVISGCSAKSDSDISADKIAEAIIERQPNPSLYAKHMTFEDDSFDVYLDNIFGENAGKIIDGVLYYADGVNACEVLVIQVSSDCSTEEISENLQDYVENRASSFYGYAPEQAALLEDFVITAVDQTVLLAVCEDSASAEDTFSNCFDILQDDASSEEETTVQLDENGWKVYNPPQKEDMSIYDTSKILEAYHSGDASQLSKQERAILDCCIDVIDETIESNMSEYSKELAIHDWIIKWADYDNGVFTNRENPNNKNPYGLLIDQEATCLGYATTFQLFMDMLDIECITVVGANYDSRQDHAWNMVCLDDEWYCVDLTWNDPIGTDANDERDMVKKTTHRYFNVTSDFMRMSDHQWDYNAIPEATGTKYAYQLE